MSRSFAKFPPVYLSLGQCEMLLDQVSATCLSSGCRVCLRAPRRAPLPNLREHAQSAAWCVKGARTACSEASCRRAATCNSISFLDI